MTRTSICFACVFLACNALPMHAAPPESPQGFTYHWGVAEHRSPRPGAVRFEESGIRDDVVVLYGHRFGRYPRIRDDGAWIDGGVPQLADLAAHLRRIRHDIEREIPDPEWDGLAVLNYEHWWPNFDARGPNGPYVVASIDLVQARMPHLTRPQAREIARVEFNEAARELYIETFRLCRQLRPNAKWGIWGLPRYRQQQQGLEQGAAYEWLWPEVDAIYIAAYTPWRGVEGRDPVDDSERPADVYRTRIADTIEMAHDVAPGKPVYLFVNWRYSSTSFNDAEYLNDIDMESTLVEPRKHGASGIIFWDAIRYEQQIQAIQKLINERLAPRIAQIDAEASDASVELEEKEAPQTQVVRLPGGQLIINQPGEKPLAPPAGGRIVREFTVGEERTDGTQTEPESERTIRVMLPRRIPPITRIVKTFTPESESK